MMCKATQMGLPDRWSRNWAHLWDDIATITSLGPMDDPTSSTKCRNMAQAMLRRHPVELDRLLRALGIHNATAEAHDRAGLREMEVLCASCSAWRRCRRAYRNGTLPELYSGFCPNAATLQALTPAHGRP
jgi:hypothetical protein